jgi:hypothetical protein
MMEFLPHTKVKNYEDNVKNQRFLQAVTVFKGRKAFFDQGQSLRVMILGQGNIAGEEEATTNNPSPMYTTTLSCYSQVAEAYSLKLEDFRKFIQQTDMDTWRQLEMNALQKEHQVLKVMEGKYKMEDQQNTNGDDYPNKYLDEEINYMKEIRQAYFMPNKEELQLVDRYYDKQDKRLRRTNQSPFEITNANSSVNRSAVEIRGTSPSPPNTKMAGKQTLEMNCKTLMAKRGSIQSNQSVSEYLPAFLKDQA